MEKKKVLEMLDEMAMEVRHTNGFVVGHVTHAYVLDLIDRKKREVLDSDAPISVYTDGSARGNGSPDAKCGWAYRLVQGDEVIAESSGCCIGGTNNQMEMLAVLLALRAIPDKTIRITVYSDSTYVVETLRGAYKIKKNEEQWKTLFAEVVKFSNIRFEWVRGHGVNIHNIAVDRAAQTAAENARRTK